jgi:molecular chaperone DnaK
VPLPTGPRELTITRLEFNAMIRPSVELTIGALKRTVASAGMSGDDLSAVLLAGGSSQVPLVTQLVFEAFDKPVRVAQHPKFTVALGAAAVGARAPATVASPTVELQPVKPARSKPRRRRWLVPTAAVALAAVAALVFSLLMLEPENGSLDNASGLSTGPEPLMMFDGGPVNPYRTFIASPDNWQGDEVVEQTASRPAITVNTADGLRVTWSGSSPGQVYLQTGNQSRDLSSYVDSAGVLSFEVLVHRKPLGSLTLATHCGYPCGAELNVTNMFHQLPVGEQRTITVPLRCFTEKGLEKTMVNTPFLLYSDGPFDSTFRNIAWLPNAANDPNTTPCDAVS